MSDEATPWWRTAVMYEIYIRSFADGDGDGVGDIAGIRDRLGHLADLGVDGIWITPWYRSPMADGGYDVADHCDIDPLFGTLADADALIAEAHALGIRVVLDLVPNHTSVEHPWFRAAVAAGPGSPERARYWFRPGRGERGEEPPNDWRSVFGGPAWTRLPATGPDDEPEWYLHLFAPEQPDLDWTNPEVRAAFDDILRFWFDRGVDGLRIDVAHGLAKDPRLADLGPERLAQATAMVVGDALPADHPHWDRAEVHEVYRRWRAIADSYAQPRMFVAEAWRVRERGLAAYLRPDELHTAFNFAFLACPWDGRRLRRTIDEHRGELAAVGTAPTWVLGSHDVTRMVTRFGALDDWRRHRGGSPNEVDLELGSRRARAATLLMLALPGSAYVYQGDELGLPEVEDLPEDTLQDPIWTRSGGTVRGRDGCRVPLPWTAEPPACGFGSAEPWLPQPASWARYAAAAQWATPGSTLRLHRDAIALRRELLGRGEHPFRWHDPASGRWAFDHGPLTCVVNLSPDDAELPAGEVLLVSAPVSGRMLPPDGAAWLRTSA